MASAHYGRMNPENLHEMHLFFFGHKGSDLLYLGADEYQMSLNSAMSSAFHASKFMSQTKASYGWDKSDGHSV